MNRYYVEVTFDFDDNFIKEKEIFLDYLTSEHWINLNSERNWRIGFKKDILETDRIEIIKEDLITASKISNIKKVDYAVILKDNLFFGSIN
ncbi:hypothetical protein [Faecalibacter rhinopitheci]|uniref:Uncharacterized protein n=1 Tax=Faecalibacter rhinopitheci TaxID=2779678 RepID=A0A8J7KAS2_9FLAO|nr:hypothetical protein [Faecalibacter rhinopitheci]MBF0597850.1 hypothetical protein [Faecalibacter rhinopitheci]MBQ0147358.1 hypothetical protein [Candidatus Onthonaster equi]